MILSPFGSKCSFISELNAGCVNSRRGNIMLIILNTFIILQIGIRGVKKANCLIQNLSEMESLPHLKIYSKSSQLSPGVFNTGGENGVNDEREEFGSKGCCIEVSERR